MTSTDHDARLSRLSAAPAGATVTVPAGWVKPTTLPKELFAWPSLAGVSLEPGDTFCNDGTGDRLCWALDDDARDRTGNWQWHTAKQLAALGLDVDEVPAPEPVPETIVTDAVPAGTAIAGDFSGETVWGAPADDGLDEAQRVRIAALEHGPRVLDVDEADEPAGETAAGFHLDESQRERVAALEHAVRVLESRRPAEPGPKQSFADILGRTGRAAVSAQDMIDVAAFIADGETGRLEVEA